LFGKFPMAFKKTLSQRQALTLALSASDFQRVLTLSGYDTLQASLCSEATEFTSQTPVEISERVKKSGRVLAELWRKEDRSSEQSQTRFYLDNDEYLYDLLSYNSTGVFAEFGAAVANFVLRKGQVRKVIDFGAGIGSLGIVLASLGFEVILADVSRPLLEFARWRFQKRGLEAEFINLTEKQPRTCCAHLVSALDTFEHITNLNRTLSDICEWLTPGGWLVFNTFSENDLLVDHDHPMHISSGRKIFPLMRSIGYGLRTEFQGLNCYRKPMRRWLPKSILAVSSQIYWPIRWKAKDLLVAARKLGRRA
jgi:2-polyprenyl-3-methyl-5-hydroxy-6-metoxy-1,4-benzoquinol methylase